MKTALLFVFIAFYSVSYSQTDNTEAQKKFKDGVDLFDAGKYENAIKMFKEAQKLDPQSSAPQYEIALTYSVMKKYEDAIEILEKIKNKPDAEDSYWSLLGSCYDLNDDRDKAFEIYEAGLKKFPKSGRLYLEMGVTNAMEKEYDKALKYFEKGIEVAPMHPSNYYWASMLWATSKNSVWSLIYGEIFLNLEKNSNRTEQISKMMFEVYKKGYAIEDTVIKTSFVDNNIYINQSVSEKEQSNQMLSSISTIAVFEIGMRLAAVGEKKIDINSLNRIRTNFLYNYFAKPENKDFAGVVFDYQKKVQDAGFLEAYNYWILLDGDKQNEQVWQSKNEELWDKFIVWFDKNPMEINESNKFSRVKNFK
ncbi:MAG: tetratricopeptide repeat protein [Ignavibacteria bacterium]|nr:tetratricopeptide repeat protein [Ignavibacteria bacterium]